MGAAASRDAVEDRVEKTLTNMQFASWRLRESDATEKKEATEEV
jgi:hypothetical protein